MNSNQIRKALMEMGFQIISKPDAGIIGVTHPNCSGVMIMNVETKALGVAHNWLCQQEAPPEAIEHSRSALIQAMQEAQG